MRAVTWTMVLALSSVACSSDSDDAVGTDASPQMNGGQTMPTSFDMGGQFNVDGAVQVDANMQVDATVPVDAGLPTDLGMNTNPDSGVPTDPTNCTGLCNYLEMCGSCFWDDAGNCLEVDGCVAVCQQETAPAVAECVAGLAACDEAAFEGCYNENAGDDDCANTCRFLEECGECFTDADGECLSIAGCAVICRESTPPAAAACIAQLSECDGIAACFQ